MEKNNLPLVSVVIPCYNHEKFVQDCIQSVIDQTYENIELIIIDDGSKDVSVAKIQEMISLCEERFVRFEFRSRPNKGLSATLNEALEWCEGQYYSPFASDDIMYSSKVENQVKYLNRKEANDVYGVFGGYELIDQNNYILSKSLRKYKEYNYNKIIMHKFELPAPTALLRLDKVRAVGGYDLNIKIEDWYMWLKLTENGGKLVYLQEIFCQYRAHGENFSKNLGIMHEERNKLLDQFSHSKKYLAAKKNIEWYRVTDYLNSNKINALKIVVEIIRKSPIEIFSKNMVRFIIHLVRSF